MIKLTRINKKFVFLVLFLIKINTTWGMEMKNKIFGNLLKLCK